MGSIILIFMNSLVSARGYGRRNGFIPANAKEQLGPGNSTMTSRKCCQHEGFLGKSTRCPNWQIAPKGHENLAQGFNPISACCANPLLLRFTLPVRPSGDCKGG